ncbi:MAG: hypothetical protein ATN36_07465 [Epulopiscium sp. Nele67-Bin005]|nr:MAG: hypothetical protein ATN36_07465 [Epulopiscium sp. Nele67-Bin005]
MNILTIIKDLEQTFPTTITNEFINSMTRTELTQSHKDIPYSKYLQKAMTKIPQEDLDFINKGPVDPKKALSIVNAKEMLNDGYLEIENGYCVMENGTGFSASKVFMPNVTPKMIDWWFNWHVLEDVRYKIWCPVGHVGISAKEPHLHLDSSNIPLNQRNIGRTHYPIEGFDIKGATQVEIKFYPPSVLGITPHMFKNSSIATFEIATCKNVSPNIPINVFFHAIREVEGGIEFRSRYWGRYTIKNNKIAKSNIPLPKNITLALARNNCIHSLIEYNHLSAILPHIYAEYNGKIIS